MIEPSGYDPVDLICLGLLVALLLRLLVRMERFYWPRVMILTFLLWVPVAYLFLVAFLGPGDFHNCMPDEDSNVYTIAEM